MLHYQELKDIYLEGIILYEENKKEIEEDEDNISRFYGSWTFSIKEKLFEKMSEDFFYKHQDQIFDKISEDLKMLRRSIRLKKLIKKI